ncbi:MAG TPA: FAD-dependent oxidoreductase [Steroidobacteraceae bacterium]|jgi:glycerol-3-phosphate dehydrogenase
MRRNPARLALDRYDIVVVGGGIYGACAAWDASLRGLKVALIDAGDFGGATSSNSLRTLHGGLRHLQRGDFPSMRESIRARRDWLRLAPHLTQPMRFVLPTSGRGLRGPAALRLALAVNDLVGLDRNRGVADTHRLPAGHVWSQRLARAVLSGTRVTGCNGAASWYDGICTNTERLLISVVDAAARSGARVANYVRATGLLRRRTAVAGVTARDELTGQEFEIRAEAVINAAGPWVGDWLGALAPPQPLFVPSKAFNLVTRPLPFREGVGLPVRPGETYFVIPWNGRALVGTRHSRCPPETRSASVTQEDVQSFLNDLNRVLGRYRLANSDVIGVFSGLLPEKAGNTRADVELERAARIVEHGAPGLVSVVGVKWTTARSVAEEAVRRVCRYLGRGNLRRARASLGTVPIELLDPDLPLSSERVVAAVREEMAVQLEDVVMRRTPLYLSDQLDGGLLESCAGIMARELRWTQRDIAEQIERTRTRLRGFRISEERNGIRSSSTGGSRGGAVAAADVPQVAQEATEGRIADAPGGAHRR